MKLNDMVRLPPHPDMQVVQVKFNVDTGAKRLLCGWLGHDGQRHYRWFTEDELELVKEA